MYIYIFGSTCRGELDQYSDIDLLAVHDFEENIDHLDANKISIYTENKLKKLWVTGNPFAWHLHLESKLVFSSDGTDFLRQLGKPFKYTEGLNDCEKFYNILKLSIESLKEDHLSLVYDLSTIFLCMRNIATCYSLHIGKPIFSRESALLLPKHPLNIDRNIFHVLEKCRLANTRGLHIDLTTSDIISTLNTLCMIRTWARSLIEMINYDDF